ncbi:MAG: tyrosine-protein phosphatase [Phycisphaerales bacterium]|jgi:protein tyrosine/serine phosphatase|nr:tyrosine-protein phosphatase [Phycisphaerales bacterium]
MKDAQTKQPGRQQRQGGWIARGALVLVALLGVFCLGYFLIQRFVRLNLHQIEDTQVYRSAQPDEELLRRLVKEDGLKSIIKLNSRNSGSRSGQEESAAAKLGIELIYLPMAMHRLPSHQEMIDLLEAIETAPRPLLIHCNAGADRTGLASVMVAMRHGRSFDQAVKEQLSVRYLHVGVWGEDVDEILDQYRSECERRGVSTGGWTEFKRYLIESYRPGFYNAKLEIRRWSPPGEPHVIQAVVRVTNLSQTPFPVDGGHPIEVTAYLPQPSGPKKILSSEPLNRALKPGESVEIPLTWKSSDVEASQTIEIDLLHREIAWFGEKGSQVLKIEPIEPTTRPNP